MSERELLSELVDEDGEMPAGARPGGEGLPLSDQPRVYGDSAAGEPEAVPAEDEEPETGARDETAAGEPEAVPAEDEEPETGARDETATGEPEAVSAEDEEPATEPAADGEPTAGEEALLGEGAVLEGEEYALVEELAPEDTLPEHDFEDEDSALPEAPLPEPMSQMVFVDVVLVLPSTHPVVVLQEVDHPYRELRIPVGGAEGVAIGYAARRVTTPRPLTHEMVSRLLDVFDLNLDSVQITRTAGMNFEAELLLSGPAGVRTVDCRPSDAVALSLRRPLTVPIMVSVDVLEAVGTPPQSGN